MGTEQCLFVEYFTLNFSFLVNKPLSMRRAVKDPFKLASSYVDCLIKQHTCAAPVYKRLFSP